MNYYFESLNLAFFLFPHKLDDEGDLVTIADDSDLQVAHTFAADGVLRLEVDIIPLVAKLITPVTKGLTKETPKEVKSTETITLPAPTPTPTSTPTSTSAPTSTSVPTPPTMQSSPFVNLSSPTSASAATTISSPPTLQLFNFIPTNVDFPFLDFPVEESPTVILPNSNASNSYSQQQQPVQQPAYADSTLGSMDEVFDWESLVHITQTAAKEVGVWGKKAGIIISRTAKEVGEDWSQAFKVFKEQMKQMRRQIREKRYSNDDEMSAYATAAGAASANAAGAAITMDDGVEIDVAWNLFREHVAMAWKQIREQRAQRRLDRKTGSSSSSTDATSENRVEDEENATEEEVSDALEQALLAVDP